MEKRRILFTDHAVPNGGQGYFPADIKRLYHIPSGVDGNGQTIGILEFSNGYNLRDATQFWQSHGITAPQVTFVSVDGTPNDRGISQADEEASLDLQWAGAIAPGAHIIVYEADGGNTYQEFAQAITRTLQYILNDSQYQPTVLSISYGDGELSFQSSDLQTWAELIGQLDAQGTTVCISSGDQGAYGLHDPNGPKVPHADAPASVPGAIAVGGTSLQPDGSETAWTYLGPDNGGATGGGYSTIFTKPSYQSTITGTGRGLPDIACNADPATGYQIIFQGQPTVVGGTSVSCPIFAAVIALANQHRKQSGQSSLSGLAQTLYNGTIQSSYRDITTGNNTFNGVTGYNAALGWDACTGFGSFDATQLIRDLSQAEHPVQTVPAHLDLHLTRQSSTDSSSWPSPPPGDKAFLVRVQGIIQRVEHDESSHDGYHHRMIVSQIQVLKVWNGTQNQIDDTVFVAIRYGDSLGLRDPITHLSDGQSIILQGRYIPAVNAYPSTGNPGNAVIDETHHPFGFVVYQDHLFR